MVVCKVKAWKSRSRRETESEEGEANESLHKYITIDPKPSDLAMGRLKPR